MLKKRLWHRRFPVNFTKFLGTPFLTEHLRWLLLKGRSDFQTKGLKRERNRDLKSTAVNKNNITISCINAIKRPFHVSDNIYGSLSGLSCRCFFKIMNFFDGFRQCFKAFSQLREVAVREFSGISKKILKKTA